MNNLTLDKISGMLILAIYSSCAHFPHQIYYPVGLLTVKDLPKCCSDDTALQAINNCLGHNLKQ